VPEPEDDYTPLENSALGRFLSRNTIESSDGLPLVHSTSAHAVKNVLASGQLLPEPCDVFLGESLSYFFYGRPSFKKPADSQIARLWEMPSALIFEYDAVKAKRIYPFDSGAFKGGRYPSFINMMDLDDYKVTAPDAPHKLVGTFFGTPGRYFRLKPRERSNFMRDFEVDIIDDEIMALHDVILSYSENVDDRRFSIEVQSDAPVSVKNGKLLAVVFPEEYLDSDPYMTLLEATGAEPLTYPTYPLKNDVYYYQIYNCVFEFYKRRGFVK
jgi:hypothetical protein